MPIVSERLIHARPFAATSEATRPRFQRVVVKVGTSTLTSGSGRLDRTAMQVLAEQIVTLRDAGVPVLLVTSGAAAAGRERLQLSADQRDVPAKQVLAAIGQALLMQRWDAIFSEYQIVVAQALLSRQDLSRRSGYLNARTTLLNLLEHAVLPIINENDVVAVDEIRIGDNDQLSALVANVVDADLLVLLTDIDGLYTADPRHDKTATRISLVERITPEIERLAGERGTLTGTGGMRTKLLAAKTATRSGTSVVITSGTDPNALLLAAAGTPLGTLFPTTTGMEGRKRWLATGLAGSGVLVVDAGASHAVRSAGRSLLAAGVSAVQGQFNRGDAIVVRGLDGATFACGLSNYSSSDIKLIAGKRSEEIAAVLGYSYGPEVIHRNNLALL